MTTRAEVRARRLAGHVQAAEVAINYPAVVSGRVRRVTLEKIDYEASMRGYSRAGLVAELLDVIAADNLFGAVLDKG